MNKFEISFFKKYINDGQEVKGIIHIHFIEIFSYIFLWLTMGALLPSFIYFYSELIQNLIPFYFLEILLIFVYIKIIYEIFNWYNDVWIITDQGIVALEWALLKTDSLSIEYSKIEGMEVEQDGLLDKILNKGNLIIHKFGDDSISLYNAQNPYEGIDLIEKINEEVSQEKEVDEEKYDIIMNALGGVVENYLENKINNEKNTIDDTEKIIKKVQKTKGTIDLRK